MTASATLTATPTTTPTATAGGSVLVLCDGQVFDGYTTKLFQLESPIHQDPSVQKVIRNCVFRNSAQPAIVIKNAKNVLIEGNTFENIRTNIAGDGVNAINIPCRAGAACTSDNRIDNITIRNNSFRYIGADGVQIGEEARYISHVLIENNEFVGRDDVGENAVDVKGVDGPIVIRGNLVHGFRPCESPKTNPPGTQDCSGSNGDGVAFHAGGAVQTVPNDVTFENNDVYDNINGLVVSSGSQNISVRGNRVYGNITSGIQLSKIYSVAVTENTLTDNPTHILVDNSPLIGGICTIQNNTFLGIGIPLVLKTSTCD